MIASSRAAKLLALVEQEFGFWGAIDENGNHVCPRGSGHSRDRCGETRDVKGI